MKKYLTSAVLLSTILLATTHAHDDRQQDISTFKLRELPQDAKNIVFGMVSAKDLQNLRVSCSQMKDTVDLHYQPYVLPRLIERASSAPSHQAVADDIAIMRLGRTKEETKAAIHNAIATHLNANSFICVEMGCPLSPYLLTHPDLKQVDISDFGTYPTVFKQIQPIYFKIFDELIPEDETEQRHALDAFAAIFSLKKSYFSQTNLAEKIRSYTQILKMPLSFQETYRTLLTDIPFYQTSHIVVSDAQIQDQTTQTKLKTILTANPSHTVVLTVGNAANTVNAQGELSSQIVTDFVKNMGIKYLHLINPRGNVKVIDDRFLSGCNKLINVDNRGFTSVQLIRDSFLSSCSLLRNVKLRDFINLQSIGDDFLSSCSLLRNVKLRDFINLQSIGDDFLSSCSLLDSFDTKCLINLQSVGNGFLSNCSLLRNVKLRDFINLQSIGDDFLSSSSLLDSFDTECLINLQSVGNGFLSSCSLLRNVNTRGLINLQSIEDDFLARCSLLDSFDTKCLINLQSIGNNFLAHCSSLTNVNTRGLINLQSIGNNPFIGCSLISINIH